MNTSEILHRLSDDIKTAIYDEKNSDINSEIASKFELSSDQLRKIFPILLKIFSKELSVLDFPAEVSKLNFPNVDLRALSLEFALKRLWPLQQYLGDVDRLILRLGGQVPSTVPQLSSHSVSPEAELIDEQHDDNALIQPVKEFMSANVGNKDSFLTQNYIADENGRPVEPTLENWLKDYLHFAGAEASDNLIRSQYLVRSENAKRLSQQEKDNVLNFLASYMESRPMRLTLTDNFLTIAEVGEASPAVQLGQVADTEELIQQYHQYVSRLDLQLDRLRDGLMVESGGEASRLADLLWNAIGLSEHERALVTLVLLAEKQYLPELLRTDQRYIGILRRYVNVRFGDRAKAVWQADWSAVNWTLFLQLLLQDKIQLQSAESAMAGEYLSQVMQLPTPPVYIDAAAGQWRWREVRYNDKRFILQ